MPQSERNTLATNLWDLITQAKEKNIPKSAIVIQSGVPHNQSAPVNALGGYCLAPAHRDKRTVRPRLYAHPRNYLRLAIAAAELVQLPRHDAILKLTEGSNHFSDQEPLGEDEFAPAEAIWRLLKLRLAVIVERLQLKQFFKAADSLSAAYECETFEKTARWKQNRTGLATSYWPSAYLCTVIKASEPARCMYADIGEEIEGIVHAVERVSLTLGWSAAGWIIAYLESHPGIAVHAYEGKREPQFDFRVSGETFTELNVGNVRFKIEGGRKITIPDSGPGDWPFRRDPRIRFDSLTPRQLASTLLETKLLPTPNQTLTPEIDTTALLAPPDSLLAILEAQLLGRECDWPHAKTRCFLDELEKDALYLKTGFEAWQQANLEVAKRDHRLKRDEAMAELARLQGGTSAE
ncbi:Uncharacterised protein [Achromobacter aegrifaciens]|uniref:Uncharacterized protein n=2 Tax=Achromobacter aegrifaciens TaxID=1287736 RepID=A0AAD2J3J2_ACHAE|nr:Uncharacterised protein [Achromobacter aegrifaciens]